MRRFYAIVALSVLLSGAAPLLACLTDSPKSSSEMACCRDMHGDCGQMGDMGCCRRKPQADAHPQMVAKAVALDVHRVVIERLMPAMVVVRMIAAGLLKAPDEHSPPGLTVARTTVLRI